MPLGWLRSAESPQGVLRVAVRVLMLACAAFWIWFAAATAWTDGGGAWLHAGKFIGIIVALVATALLKPRWGGVALVAAGIFAGFFFHHLAARLMLAVPAVLVGLGLIRWR